MCALVRVYACVRVRVCVSSCGFVIKSTFTDRNNVSVVDTVFLNGVCERA